MTKPAWLTPENMPGDWLRRAVFIPNDAEWLRALYGCFIELSKTHNWEKHGAQEPADVAARWWDAFEKFYDREGHVLDIGDVFFSANSATPAGCLACDGSEYDPGSYPALFAIIGYTFGTGSGSNFCVPDLRGRMPVGTGSGSGLTPRSLADSGGLENVILSNAEMPSHVHSQPSHVHSSHDHASGVAVTPGELPIALPPMPANTGSAGGDDTGSAGSDQAHENMPPFLALCAYIVAE
jgi:microcystin-dependent protein